MAENVKPVRAAGDVASRWLSRAAILLVGVAAVLGWGASFVGLHAYGMQSMSGFTYWSAWLVPGTFDGAAFACTLLTYRSSINGRSSMRGRLLMWAFTGVSSWINWIHQPSHQAQIVAAGLPIAAVAVFDIVLIELRADFEARHGRRGFRLRPGLLLLRWLVDRSSTRDAFRRQVIDIPVEEIAGLGPVPTGATGTDTDPPPATGSAESSRDTEPGASTQPPAEVTTETPVSNGHPPTNTDHPETADRHDSADEREAAEHAERSNGRAPATVATIPKTAKNDGPHGAGDNGPDHSGSGNTGGAATTTGNDDTKSAAAESATRNSHTTRNGNDRDKSGPETARIPLSAIAEAGATFARMSAPSRPTAGTADPGPRPQTARRNQSAEPKPRPDNTSRADRKPSPARTPAAAKTTTPAKTTVTAKSQTTARLRAPVSPEAPEKPRPQGQSPTRPAAPERRPATPATADQRQPNNPADKRAAARRDYLTAVRAQRPITGAELGARYGLSASWGQKQIAAARQENPDRD